MQKFREKTRSLVSAAPKPKETATFIYYYGPTFSDSQTYEIPEGLQILQHPKFDSSKKTVLYIHGYEESPEVESVHVIVDAYLERGDHNIIIIDWHDDAAGNYLLSAVPKMKRLGAEVAKTLFQMFGAGLNIDQFHLVGHSLGGQMSGYIGRDLKRISEKKLILKRISGLDPAFPGFYPGIIGSTHISQSDAEYVDIIHTDAWLYGAPTSTGTVDFWPNGGKTLQPGCPRRNFKPLSDNDLCSHRRSWRFWAESVANKSTQKFNAIKTRSWRDFKNGRTSEVDPKIVMGIDCPIGLSGDYYLQTNGETPYAKGPDGTTYVKESKK